MWWFRKQQPVQVPARPAEVAFGSGSVNLDKFATDLSREFVRSIYLWRAVDMIASMAASVPLKVYKANDNSQLTRAEMDVENLLVRPNPQWNGHALQYFVAASIAVANKAFLLRVRGTGDTTQELWPLGVNEVTVVYQQNSRVIERFEVST